MDTRHFEDFTVGETMDTGPVEVTEAEIVAFAGKYDPQLMHTDPEAAKDITNGLIASGWHTASMTMGLFVTGRPFIMARGTVGLGVDKLKWHQPVRPGDTLRLHTELTAARPSSSRPDRGIITTHLTTTNQRNEPVLEMMVSAIVPKRQT